MAYCGQCGKEFGDIFSMASLCGDCRRLKLDREERDRLETERADRVQREEDRRHQERLSADADRFAREEERERDKRVEDELRQFDEEQRRLEREDEIDARESEREAFLDRQRDQLANAWKYEAQSKLSEAEKLYKAGALDDALRLANDATALGLTARRLLGWIYRDRGDNRRYAEQLMLQIGLLPVRAPTDQHTRVLREVVGLGAAGQVLLKEFLSCATKWTFFPYAIQDVLAASSLTGLDHYRDFLATHIERVAAEREYVRDTIYGKRFLRLLLDVEPNGKLLDRYVAAVKDWRRFPTEVIHWLLEYEQLDRAKSLFSFGSKLVNEDLSSPIYLWQICPLGIDLAERGGQPRDWEKKFRAGLKAGSFDKIQFGVLRETFEAPWFSSKAAMTIRRALAEKCALALRSERAETYKTFRKEKKKPQGLPFHQGADLFAVVVTAATALIMWATGAPAGFTAGVAVVVFFGSRALKRLTNVRLFADVRLAQWESNRREALAHMASLADPEMKRGLGVTSGPAYTTRLIKDALSVAAILVSTFGAALYFTNSDLKERGVGADGSEWSRDWEAFSPATKTRLVALTSVSDTGVPTMTFYERGMVGGALRSKPISVVRLSGCVGTSAKVGCSAVSSVVGNSRYASVPAKLELNLVQGTGTFTLFPKGEGTLAVELRETPKSLTGAPKWVKLN